MISSSHFDDVFRLSAMMNAAHRRQVPPWETVCWFRLFKKVDSDGSGLISYDEFLEMVRKDLKLSAHALPSDYLHMVWLALDTDGSGYLSSGEFGAFMRLAAPQQADRAAPRHRSPPGSPRAGLAATPRAARGLPPNEFLTRSAKDAKTARAQQDAHVLRILRADRMRHLMGDTLTVGTAWGATGHGATGHGATGHGATGHAATGHGAGEPGTPGRHMSSACPPHCCGGPPSHSQTAPHPPASSSSSSRTAWTPHAIRAEAHGQPHDDATRETTTPHGPPHGPPPWTPHGRETETPLKLQRKQHTPQLQLRPHTPHTPHEPRQPPRGSSSSKPAQGVARADGLTDGSHHVREAAAPPQEELKEEHHPEAANADEAAGSMLGALLANASREELARAIESLPPPRRQLLHDFTRLASYGAIRL